VVLRLDRDSLSQRTPTGSVLTREFDGNDWIAKLTWQAADSLRVSAKVSGDPAEISNRNASEDVGADAGSRTDQGGQIYQAELNWVASDSVLFSLQAGLNDGYLDSYPMSGDLTLSGYHNEETDFYFNNYYNAQYSERDSTQAKTALSYFAEDLLGPHEFKVGVEYRELYYSGNNFYTGGGLYEGDDRVRPGDQPDRARLRDLRPRQRRWVDHNLTADIAAWRRGWRRARPSATSLPTTSRTPGGRCPT